MMRIMLAAAAALALAGCAEGYDGYGYGGGGVAYYDGFYGPFYDGYWGHDGAYYYRGGHGRPWTRDEGGHFRRREAQGYHGVHGHGGPMGFHHGPRPGPQQGPAPQHGAPPQHGPH